MKRKLNKRRKEGTYHHQTGRFKKHPVELIRGERNLFSKVDAFILGNISSVPGSEDE